MKLHSLMTITLAAGFLSMVPACSDEARLGLLPARSQDDAEHERLRRMQMVHVLSFRPGAPASPGEVPQGGNLLDTPVPFEITPSALESELLSSMCSTDENNGPPCNGGGGGNGCMSGACSAQIELCVGNHLLDAARIRATPIHIQTQPRSDGGFDHDFLIPPQTVATNAALARLAFQSHLPIAMVRAFGTLRSAVGLDPLDDGSTCSAQELEADLNPDGVVPTGDQPKPGASTVGAFLSNIAVESYNVFREAALKASEFSLAVADAQRSNPSLALQVSRGQVGTELSRLAAAHILVGGDPGLAGKTDLESRAGLCSVPELSAQAQQAISIFRESGVAPVAIQDSAITLDTLLEGPLTEGSVKLRLGERWNYDFSAPPPGVPANQKVADYFHLEAQDFAQARDYLSEEITAFSRSLSAQIDPPPSPNPSVTPHKLFVATARSPKPMPPTYYGVLARYDATPHTAFTEPRFVQSDDSNLTINHVAAAEPGAVNLAGGIDAALTQAAAVLSQQSQISDLATRALVMNPLASLLAAKERPGRLVACRLIEDPTSTVFPIAPGYGKDEGLRLMLGEDGLRCAIDGSIEGAPCTDQFETLTLAHLDSDYYEGSPSRFTGFDKAAFGVGARPTTELNGSRVYLVRPSGASQSPGAFVQLAGVTIVPGLDGCTDVPIIPEVEQRVADIMAPNRKWCTSSQVSCAGTDFDARLPLEDELSNDNNGVESSWKHYLDLAKQAATESDLLGQDYLQKGLEFDQDNLTVELRDDQKEELAEDKGIQAINELQEICGTAVDPLQLLKLLSTGTDKSDFNLIRDTVACPNGNINGSECSKNYECIAGQCVLSLEDWLKDHYYEPDASDIRRIADCVNGKSTVDLVHLGRTRPLCVWRDIFDHRLICQGADQTHPCPDLSSEGTCSNLLLPLVNSGHLERHAVTDSLGLMDTSDIPTTLPSGDRPMNACDAIRELRGRRDAQSPPTNRDTDLFDMVAKSTAARFHPVNVRTLAKRIGFEPRYGDYAAITLDGGAEFSTGSSWVGTSMTWPCVAMDAQGCMTHSSGLFCDKAVSCDDRNERVRMNDRMMRAVMAIAATLRPDLGSTSPLGEFLWFNSIRKENTSFADSSVRQLVLGPETFPVVENLLSYPGGATYKVYDSPGDPKAKIAYNAVRFFGHAPTPINMDHLVPGGDPRDDSSWRLTVGPIDFPGSLEVRKGLADTAYYDGLTSDPAQIQGYYASVLLGTAVDPSMGSFPLPFTPTIPGGYLSYVHFDYERDSLLDGLELLCQLSEKPRTCSPPLIASVADLPKARDFMECIADQTRDFSARVVLSDFPVAAFNSFRPNTTVGSFPAVGGDLGVNISELRSAVNGLVDVPLLISGEMRKFGHQIDSVYNAIQNAGLSERLADVQLESTLANQAAACIGSAGVGSITSLGSVATCANSIAQGGFAREINSLTKQKSLLEKGAVISQFAQQFSDTSTNMARYALQLTNSVETVDRELAKVELQKGRAKLALARALHVHTFHSHFQDRVHAVLLSRFQTAGERYKSAFDTAQRMAFLAKRAIEMRLGVKLSQMAEDLPLVTAPANWESTVCTSTGVNFDKIAESGQAGQSFTDSFIGAYVDKLANVVESYRLVNNFHEGADAAVISIRDDVQNVRAVCDVEVSNLFFNAGQFDVPSADKNLGWDRVGCLATIDQDGISHPVPNCIGTFPVDERPTPAAGQAFANVRAYRLRFGDGAGCTDSAACGYQTGAKLVQKVPLNAGRYRSSLYVKDPTLYSDLGLVIDGEEHPVTIVAPATSIPVSDAWSRFFVVFDVDSPQTVSIGLRRPTGGSVPGEVVVGAPLLESVPDLSDAAKADPPGAFSNTTSVRTVKLPLCEDTDGRVFRTKGWTRGSALLCDDGFSGNCLGASAKSFGYWETNFAISQRDIEAGRILGNAGFARGNFNYRIDSIGVNFVGTGIHDCSDSKTPSTCYSAGFVPYTLIHDGPYFVRNYQGQDFEAELFTGRIENARGLATERYLTNPLSSADQGLIKDYLRSELQGRPLDGNFILRVWDSPGVTFDAIKDVQIVLNYRYWTRFN